LQQKLLRVFPSDSWAFCNYYLVSVVDDTATISRTADFVAGDAVTLSATNVVSDGFSSEDAISLA